MGLYWGETAGQPSQTRDQLRGSLIHSSHIQRGPSGAPGVPYLIIPWCRWPHFLAIVPLPTLCKQPRMAAHATLEIASLSQCLVLCATENAVSSKCPLGP